MLHHNHPIRHQSGAKRDGKDPNTNITMVKEHIHLVHLTWAEQKKTTCGGGGGICIALSGQRVPQTERGDTHDTTFFAYSLAHPVPGSIVRLTSLITLLFLVHSQEK